MSPLDPVVRVERAAVLAVAELLPCASRPDTYEVGKDLDMRDPIDTSEYCIARV